MNPKLRAFLEKNGLRKGADEADAWARYDELVKDGLSVPGIAPGERAAKFGGPPPASVNTENPDGSEGDPASGSRSEPQKPTGDTDPSVSVQVQRGIAANTARCSAVRSLLNVAGFTGAECEDFRRSLIDDTTMTEERASKAILEKLRSENKPFGVGAQSQVTVGLESGDKLRLAMTDGMALRMGMKVEKPAAGYKDFRGRSLLQIGEEILQYQGVNTRSMGKRELATRAMSALSTSDFGHIFSELTSRRLLAAYNEWPQTWRPLVSVVSATDFKDMHAIALSGSPDLKGLGENGEYKSAKFSDRGEKYRVMNKGIITKLSREMVINDDLRAFARIPQLFGAAARRMEAAAVYSLITSNPKMASGTPLFHAFHGNISPAGALNSDTLALARVAMRKQKGMAGEKLDITPAFLLTGVEDELNAETILRSTAIPKENMSAGVHNPWAGKLTPIADVHVESGFYLLGHPNQAPVIEAAYLEGEEQPYVEEMVDFDSDALKIKCRHDFGAGVVDHVGAHYVPAP